MQTCNQAVTLADLLARSEAIKKEAEELAASIKTAETAKREAIAQAQALIKEWKIKPEELSEETPAAEQPQEAAEQPQEGHQETAESMQSA